MIRSMTGFGRAAFELGGRTYEVEIRTVNHRHLDTKLRLPRAMAEQEGALKALVAERLHRGKVDVNVSAPGGGTTPGELQIDETLASRYVGAARELAAKHELSGALDVSTLLSMPGVTRFVEPELEPERVAASLAEGVGAALTSLQEMRRSEGKALEAELNSRLSTVEGLVSTLAARSSEVVQAAKDRLRKRTEQIRQETGLLDEARLHQEIVIAADRLDITEEIVRLRSHVDQFRTIIAVEGQPVGRRLDFLLQEMGREANTVGSKANDAPLAHDVVEMKTELERIREQVQNVE
jgi:uncharacterized protein (TIGR00255 family)